jgi:class 3 adenylate cyclase/TolB-like protein
MSDEVIDRKIAVILVADVVGYSKHMEKDEDATLKAYSECEKILKVLLDKRQGSIFNTAGDSVLVEFPSAVNAVECAVEFQNKIKERNQSEKTTTKLEYRIGINMGDVVSREGNLLGDGVNIAARLEALCQPNSVCISKSIYDLVVPKTKMTFNDLGIQKVKQNSFHAYDILLNPSQKRKIKSKQSFRSSIMIGAFALVAVVVLAVGFIIQQQSAYKVPDFDGRVLLVRPFDYLTDDENKAFLADSMLNVFVTGLSGYQNLKILSKNTSKLVKEENLSDTEVAKRFGANLILTGSITVYGTDMRTSLEIRNIEDGTTLFSDLKNAQTQDLFKIQDDLVVSVLESLELEEDKIRVSNEGVQTIEELRLLHFAAKEREKWSRDSYARYEEAVEKLYSINPNGYTHNVSQGWKYHYKMRLGLCIENDSGKIGATNCMIEAIKYAERAIEINPNKADAYLAKSYYLSSLYLINRGSDRMMEWGGLDAASEYAVKGLNLITDNPYQFGLAGEVFTFTGNFQKATDSFAKLFEADDNPGDTFTSFYMQSSYLNKDFDIVEKLARRIISENKLKDKDDCFKPFCGNAGFAYLFLIYAVNSKQNPDKVEQYLSEFRSVRNSYTREMWIGRDNPFHYIWNKEATEITQLMDDLGW